MCPTDWLAAWLADLPLDEWLARSIVRGRCYGWQLDAWPGADIADLQQSPLKFQPEIITISMPKRSNESIYYFSISIGVPGTGFVHNPCDETTTICSICFHSGFGCCFYVVSLTTSIWTIPFPWHLGVPKYPVPPVTTRRLVTVAPESWLLLFKPGGVILWKRVQNT